MPWRDILIHFWDMPNAMAGSNSATRWPVFNRLNHVEYWPRVIHSLKPKVNCRRQAQLLSRGIPS